MAKAFDCVLRVLANEPERRVVQLLLLDNPRLSHGRFGRSRHVNIDLGQQLIAATVYLTINLIQQRAILFDRVSIVQI